MIIKINYYYRYYYYYLYTFKIIQIFLIYVL